MTKHTLNLIIINLILTRSYFIIILSLQYYQQILCHLSIDRVVLELEKVFSLPTINQNWWEWSPAYISCRDRVLELTGVHRCDCVIQSAPLPPPATTELSHITDYSKQTLSSPVSNHYKCIRGQARKKLKLQQLALIPPSSTLTCLGLSLQKHRLVHNSKHIYSIYGWIALSAIYS